MGNDYIFDNTGIIQELQALDKEIETEKDEFKIEELSEKYDKLENKLVDFEYFQKMINDTFDNVYQGQQGNGYYYTGSNIYADFFYGTDNNGNDVVIEYSTEDGTLLKGFVR